MHLAKDVLCSSNSLAWGQILSECPPNRCAEIVAVFSAKRGCSAFVSDPGNLSLTTWGLTGDYNTMNAEGTVSEPRIYMHARSCYLDAPSKSCPHDAEEKDPSMLSL